MALFALAETKDVLREPVRLHGIEDRISQADFILVGRAKLLTRDPAGATEENVTARLTCRLVLKGKVPTATVEYRSVYYPYGISNPGTTSSGPLSRHRPFDMNDQDRIWNAYSVSNYVSGSEDWLYFFEQGAPFYCVDTKEEPGVIETVEAILQNEKASGNVEERFKHLVNGTAPAEQCKYAIRWLLRSGFDKSRQKALLGELAHRHKDDGVGRYATKALDSVDP